MASMRRGVVTRGVTAGLLLAAAVARADGAGDPVAAAIARRLDVAAPVAVDGVPVDAAVLRAVYAPRQYAPLWDDRRAAAVLDVLRTASAEGLEPAAYHVSTLDALGGTEPDARAARDLLLTDGVMHYAVDVHSGAVSARQWSPEVEVAPRPSDPVALVLAAGLADDPTAYLRGLAPQHAQYAALREVLAQLRTQASAGGWPTVPAGPSIKPGASDPVIPVVRRRLAATGELAHASASPTYDPELVAAVKRFQETAGLEPDGVLGAGTRAALGVSVDERIAQVVANLERLRWLPDDLGNRYVRVNIPAYALEVVEDGHQAAQIRVVVGRPDRRTPIVSSRITHLVFNPPWTVPQKLAKEDMLPKLRRNGGFLANQGIRLYASWQPGAAQVDGSAVDWSTVGAGHIAGLRMRQDPGPSNPLGRVKFNLPNGFDVYLHDTNHKNFFAQNMRALSSGCVRVQDALGLADVLLHDDPRWTPEKRKALTSDWTTRTVSLTSPVPVYLVYETVWRDGAGRVQVRQDIYGRDASLAKAVAATARRGRPLAST